jgi:ankyrin repeat protein
VLLHGPGNETAVLEPGTATSGWLWLGMTHEPTIPGGPVVRQLRLEAQFLHEGEAWATDVAVPTTWLRPGPEDELTAGRAGQGQCMATGISDVFAGLDPWPESLLPRARVPSHITGFSYDVEVQQDMLVVDLSVGYAYLHYRRPLAELLFGDVPLRWEQPTGAMLERTIATVDAGLIRAAFAASQQWRGHPEVVRALALSPIQRGRLDLVELALELGLDARYRLPGGATLLHFAVTWKHEPIVRRLLTAGVDPNGYDDAGDTALHRAVKTDQLALADTLMAGGARDDLPQLKTGVTAARMKALRRLHSAAAGGDVEMVGALLAAAGGRELVDDEIDGKCALLIAAQAGHAAVVDALARVTTQLDRLSSTGTPWNALQCAVGHRNVAAVEVLLRHGADPNLALPSWSVAGVTTPGSRRPLHLAADVSSRRIARLLLDQGADVNAQDGEGETALTIAARHRYGHKLAELLLDRGADPDVRTRDGSTAIDKARRHRHARVVAVLEGR